MQVRDAFTESNIHFDEPVKSLLREKGRAVWSISPEATVYEAIERMSDNHIGALIVLSARSSRDDRRPGTHGIAEWSTRRSGVE
jgi:CBS domain-containing protein